MSTSPSHDKDLLWEASAVAAVVGVLLFFVGLLLAGDLTASEKQEDAGYALFFAGIGTVVLSVGAGFAWMMVTQRPRWLFRRAAWLLASSSAIALLAVLSEFLILIGRESESGRTLAYALLGVAIASGLFGLTSCAAYLVREARFSRR